MSKLDPSAQGGAAEPARSGVSDSSLSSPAVFPPSPLSPPKKRLSALAITAICAGSVVLFLGTGILAVGIVVKAHAAESRQEPSQRVRAVEPREPLEPAATKVGNDQGLSYFNDKKPNGPISIHVLKIDRSRKDLGFFSAHARDKVLAVSLLADQARSVPPSIGRALAGVNGDFYMRDRPTYAGDPRGLQIVNGELISAPDTVCVWFDNDGNPHLDEVKGQFSVTWPDGTKTPLGLNQERPAGTAVLYTPTLGLSTRTSGGRELILEKDGDSPWLPLEAGQSYRARVQQIATNGNTRLTSNTLVLSLSPQLLSPLANLKPDSRLEISTATTPDLKGVKAALGGGPALIKDGKPFADFDAPAGVSRDWSQRSKYEPHPRSAMGWSKTHVYFVTVDGRQPGLSMGMKLAELAQYMVKLGCTDAINLDGGKSAQLWINGQIVNSPCQGEDTVANSLLVIRKADRKADAK